MAGEEIRREDAEALLATRRELGASYDEALVDSFAERLERAVGEQARRQVEAERLHERAEVAVRRDASLRQFVLAILSLVACIPISIPLGLQEKYLALLIVLLTIATINVTHALQSRPRS